MLERVELKIFMKWIEEISDYLKTFSKSVTEVENMTLKSKVLLGGWLSTARKVFRRDKMREKKFT